MTYDQQFSQLITKLREECLIYGDQAGEYSAFLDYYQKTDEPGVRPLSYEAEAFSRQIDPLVKGLARGNMKGTEAYLRLLCACLPEPQAVGLRAAFRKRLHNIVDEKKITDIDKQFLFLSKHAMQFIPVQKFNGIMRQIYSEKIDLAEGNWLIAVALYEEYKRRGKLLFQPQKKLMESILVGFLNNRLDDFMQARQAVSKQADPFSVGDYLFHQMTHKAFETVSTSGSPNYGPYKRTLWHDIKAMKARHALDGDDDYLNGEMNIFLRELNALIQTVTDTNKRDELRRFVRELNVLDLKAREIKGKAAKLKSMALTDTMRTHFAQSLSKEVQEMRMKISKSIPSLKLQAGSLFDQGKEGNLTRKIIGLGVLAISSIVAILCVASLLLLPAGVFLGTVAGVAVTYEVIASAGIGLSGVGIIAGSSTFFSSLKKKPAEVATAVDNIITYIETKGRKACDIISPPIIMDNHGLQKKI